MAGDRQDVLSLSSRGAGVLALLVASALALALAPLLMPADYSWVSNSTSESAAQGVDGAWLARLGFLALGFGVLWLARIARGDWGRWGTALHTTFGVLIIAAAAFSTRPWQAGAPYDGFEDLLHSIAASTMGFAFAFGVLAVAARRIPARPGGRVLDAIAIVAVVALPLGITMWDDAAGVLQRALFLVAYVWYGAEAARLARADASPQDELRSSAPGS